MAKKLGTLKVKRLFLGTDSGKRGSEVTSSAAELNIMDGVTATATELNYTDGALYQNNVALKTVLVDAGGNLQMQSNAGSGNGPGVSATEYGTGLNHLTRLAVTTLGMPDAAAAAAETLGVLLYTFPATGDIIIKNATYAAYVTIDGTGNDAKTPEFALGSAIGSGASATTDGDPTYENIMTGTAGTADGSTATELSLVQSVVLAKGTNTLNFNIADTWAAASTATSVTGVFFIEWGLRII